MKFIAMGFVMSLAAAIGCMSPPDRSPAPADETQAEAQGEDQAEVIQPREPQFPVCSGKSGTCETASFCRSVGTNLGRLDCPSGFVCCR